MPQGAKKVRSSQENRQKIEEKTYSKESEEGLAKVVKVERMREPLSTVAGATRAVGHRCIGTVLVLAFARLD